MTSNRADAGATADTPCDDCIDALSCGDGVLTENEACDDGNDNDLDACAQCKIAACGDGFVFQFQEQCDDGNQLDGDGCSSSCKYEDCGDGELQELEECEGIETRECVTSCSSIGSSQCDALTCTYALCTPPAETCNGKDDDCQGLVDRADCMTPVYRYYNGSIQDHRHGLSQTPPAGYSLENLVFYVYSSPVPSTLPLYQKVNDDNNHALTILASEGDELGYRVESVLGYVLPASATTWNASTYQAQEYCRYVNSSTVDRLTQVRASAERLAGQGYALEGCQFVAWHE